MAQCQCYTQKGTRCTFNAKKNSKFCGRHQNCKKTSVKSVPADDLDELIGKITDLDPQKKYWHYTPDKLATEVIKLAKKGDWNLVAIALEANSDKFPMLPGYYEKFDEIFIENWAWAVSKKASDKDLLALQDLFTLVDYLKNNDDKNYFDLINKLKSE